MNTVGQPERATQNRIIALFRDELGYRYLGDWSDRTGFDGKGNSNIEEGLLTDFLSKNGYSPTQISRTLDRLRTEAGNPSRSLYDNNKAVYSLLRFGVQVQAAAGENNETINLINWEEPAQNDFAIAGSHPPRQHQAKA